MSICDILYIGLLPLRRGGQEEAQSTWDQHVVVTGRQAILISQMLSTAVGWMWGGLEPSISQAKDLEQRMFHLATPLEAPDISKS